MKLPLEAVFAVGRALLLEAEVPPDHADTTMRVLLMAERWGVASHGLLRLPWYLDRLHAGGVNPRAQMVLVGESTATQCFDGQAGLGQVQLWKAAERGVELAAQHGVSVVAVGNSSHSGCLGAYVVPALERGMVAMLTCNGPAVMPPWGGSSPLFSTSALAAGVPSPSGAAIIDMSLSAVARGRIAEAAQDDSELEDGWAYASDGHPTIDPDTAMEGMLAPFGGMKGAVLSFLVETLTGGLVGPALSPDVADPFAAGDRDRPQRIGHLVLTLDPETLDVDGSADARLARLAGDIAEVGGRVPGAARLPLLKDDDQPLEVADAVAGELLKRAQRARVTVPEALAAGVAAQKSYVLRCAQEVAVTERTDFVVHDQSDDVGIVVRDVSGGEQLAGRVLGDGTRTTVVVTDDIPLGHKVALQEIAEGAEVTKYGTAIGVSTARIGTGDHVHIHNVRSTRWPGN